MGTTTGLTTVEALRRIARYGPNELEATRSNRWWKSALNIVREPMFILLALAFALYALLGDTTESVMMLVSIVFVVGIEMYQEARSEKALAALRRYTQARVRTLRDGTWSEVESAALAPGDVVRLEEGERIPADGRVLRQNDLAVDEAVLTGESLPVEKAAGGDPVYQGTTVVAGECVVELTETGARTQFGQLGRSIESIESTPTPLQQQIGRFVRQMGLVGGAAFMLVLALNLVQGNTFVAALLFSLTLAMAILPEEIPVAFSTFMALGAYRMIRHGILARQPKTVESLGSATVICLDKTGTITENRMSVAEVVDATGHGRTLEYALWASEPEPFDAMEKAVAAALAADPRRDFELVREYALSGRPPMMTHVWEHAPTGRRIVACKGAVERILAISALPATRRAELEAQVEAFTARGFRVLGVASARFDGKSFPVDQSDFPWTFEGLIAFFDPPKANAAAVFETFARAGIRLVMLTGDHAGTAKNIARLTGWKGWEVALTGREVMELDDAGLAAAVGRINIFARMFPEAKLRVINALKASGETVAMSGDGVNDGPALKAAQIGVAMGLKGTEIAKSTASLVLLQDDLAAMTTAIAIGRRIYDNLLKAIRYIISIHVPIVLTVLLPLLLGWPYPHIFLPLHVIFLELVMDPTAAVAFENEPAERNLMEKPPRRRRASLFTGPELGISLLQGLIVAAVVLLIYRFALDRGHDEAGVRAMVFATLVFSNLFLTLATRSFEYPITRTLRYKNRVLPAILAISMVMLAAILYVPFLAAMFAVAPLAPVDLGICALAGFSQLAWFEAYKLIMARFRRRPV
jgi:Ca2+-transporting ATPase